MRIENFGNSQIAVIPAKKTSGFIAWGKHGIIESDGPVFEPGEVWFNFGKSEDEAISKVAQEMGLMQ